MSPRESDPFRIDVTDRLPQWLSPSAADTYAQCPKQFFYKYILGIRTPGTIHTLKGNLAHTAFERIFDHDRAERTPEVARAYLRPALAVTLDPFVDRDTVDDSYEIALRDLDRRWSEHRKDGTKDTDRALRDAADAAAVLADHDRDELLAELEGLVDNWFRMEDPTRFTPAGREVYVRAKAAGVPLHGFIDRLDRVQLKSGAEAWVVSDYKSGKVADERYLAQKFFQLRVYALLLREIHGYTPRLLRLVYVKGGTPDAVKKLPVNDDTLDRTGAQLKAMWNAIRRDAKRNQWDTKTGPLCPWCDFQPVCPAFNDDAEGLLAEEQELYGLDAA